MTDRDRLQAENIADVLAHGPGIRRGRNVWIEARDPRGYVLLGGLGAMGVGQMWVTEQKEAIVHGDGSRTPAHSEAEEYADAPIRVRLCGAYAPSELQVAGTYPRTCALPYDHDGDHLVDEQHLVLPAGRWQGPPGAGVW